MYKAKLQELCQRTLWSLPDYSISREGPDHNPRFKASVTVNGVVFVTANVSRSSKQALNDAAKLAFDHFSSQPVRPPKTIPRDASTSSFSDVLHLYKTQLQNYAQKANLDLPVYTCESEGPPHASCFKSKVTVGGQTYEGETFFRTVKEAEHAAAKIALMSLTPDGAPEDDSGIYKTFLQALAQREGFSVPVYGTKSSGESHMPTFISTVEVGGNVFHGQKAKTKKQAEMSAAKVAYTSLQEGKSSHVQESLHCPSSNLQPIGVTDLQLNDRSEAPLMSNLNATPEEKAERNGARDGEVFSFKAMTDDRLYKNLLQELTQKEGLCSPIYSTKTYGPSHKPTFISTVEIEEQVFEGQTAETKKQAEMNAAKVAYTSLTEGRSNLAQQILHRSSSNSKSTGIADLQHSLRSEALVMSNSDVAPNEQAENDGVTEDFKAKHPPAESPKSDIGNTRNRASSSPEDSSLSLPASCDSSDIKVLATGSSCSTVMVYPRIPNMTFPADVSLLPFSNDRWVALSLNQAEQYQNN